MPPVLVAQGLRKRYGNLEAVRDVSFEIAEGETFGLLGPNGAGKTTAISMIAGILERDDGEVVVAGRPVSTHSPSARGAIGLVPQDLAIYPDLTARENLAFFGRLYDVDELRPRVEEILEMVGLSERADDPAKEFSGGMKRRLNIGIGLLHRPALLILDEPTVGVDPQSRNAILESVEDLAREGMAVLYTTHYMEEAERLCDRVAIIDEGRIEAMGTRRELVELVGEQDQVRLVAGGALEEGAAAAGSIEGVTAASVAESGLEIVARNGGALLPRLLTVVADAGVQVQGVEVTEPNLEAVFLHLTGKALRD